MGERMFLQNRLQLFRVSLFLVGCFASLPASSARNKGTPHRLAPPASLNVTSMAGVAVYTVKNTRIFPKGETTCSRGERDGRPFIYCRGEDKATQFTLAGPIPQTLEIQSDAITSIESGTTACRISPGEEVDPSIHCGSSTKAPSPAFPGVNGWVREHDQAHEINDLLAPQSEEECHGGVQTCEELEVQIVEDEGQDSPDTHTLRASRKKKRLKESGLYPPKALRILASRLYQCDQCSYTTDHQGNLNRHKRTHLQGDARPKPLSCDQCSYTTDRTGNLKQHQRTHLQGGGAAQAAVL